MDIQKLDIHDGDVIVVTYNDELDADTINSHYEALAAALNTKYDCIVIANHTDFMKNITILSSENGGLPFR
jgi:hypothetical protein